MYSCDRKCRLIITDVISVSLICVRKVNTECWIYKFRKGRAALTLILLMWRIWWPPNSIPRCIQQDATLHSLFISRNSSTCFGWFFHPSSGAHTIVSTASGICHTVTAICRYRGRVGTGLSVLWVAYATHSTLKPQCLYKGALYLFLYNQNSSRKTRRSSCKAVVKTVRLITVYTPWHFYAMISNIRFHQNRFAHSCVIHSR
jgi:hypothetical protein